jgi:ATP-dependent Clp protease protease subunit
MENFRKDYELFARSEFGIGSNTLNEYDKYLVKTNSGYVDPYILEEREMNVTQMSVFSRLFKDRILFLGTEINSDSANILMSQLMYLNSVDDTDDIKLYINSGGGSVYDGLGIYDVMNYIEPEVSTYCMGTCASMAAVLLSSGAEGKRYALPHGKIMIHQPSTGIGRIKAEDLRVEFEEMEKCKSTLYGILAENMNKSPEEVAELCRLDKWYTSDEACAAGLIDTVIRKKKK